MPALTTIAAAALETLFFDFASKAVGHLFDEVDVKASAWNAHIRRAAVLNLFILFLQLFQIETLCDENWLCGSQYVWFILTVVEVTTHRMQKDWMLILFRCFYVIPAREWYSYLASPYWKIGKSENLIWCILIYPYLRRFFARQDTTMRMFSFTCCVHTTSTQLLFSYLF